jgi:hypothetical protein
MRRGSSGRATTFTCADSISHLLSFLRGVDVQAIGWRVCRASPRAGTPPMPQARHPRLSLRRRHRADSWPGRASGSLAQSATRRSAREHSAQHPAPHSGEEQRPEAPYEQRERHDQGDDRQWAWREDQERERCPSEHGRAGVGRAPHRSDGSVAPCVLPVGITSSASSHRSAVARGRPLSNLIRCSFLSESLSTSPNLRACRCDAVKVVSPA